MYGKLPKKTFVAWTPFPNIKKSVILACFGLTAFSIVCQIIGPYFYNSDTKTPLSGKRSVTDFKNLVSQNNDRGRGRLVSSSEGEARKIVFAKVHKAGSTTVANMLVRFSMSRRLNVLFPRFSNLLSEFGTKIDKRKIVKIPEGETFDILCNHLIFDKHEIEPYFSSPPVYIAIVREPFQQFVSAFKYYYSVFKLPELVTIVKSHPQDPIHGFLNDTTKYSHLSPLHSFINNRMSIDLGFPVNNFYENKRNKTFIKNFLRKLNATFDLFLIADYFDESMVLLRRRLGWQTKDIVYIAANKFDHKQTSKRHWLQDHDYGSDVKNRFSEWGNIDIELYNFVLYERFLKEIQNQGSDLLEEVVSYKSIRPTVKTYCQSKTEANLTVEGTRWSPSFHVTQKDCRLMLMGPHIFFLGRRLQNERHGQ